MPTYHAPLALLAHAVDVVAVADLGPKALLAHAVMLAYQSSDTILAGALAAQMPESKHSLHWLLAQLCSHSANPPHSLL